MRYPIALLLMAAMAVLSACAPQVRADAGEVVYEVPVSSQLGVLQLTAAGDPVVTRMAQELVVFYQIEATPPAGYGRWVQQLGESGTVIYVSERRNEKGETVAKVEMRWALTKRADGFGSVRMQILSSEQVDVRAVEAGAFYRLDRVFRRVASAR